MATQQRRSADSKTMRTVETDGGSSIPNPPPPTGVGEASRSGVLVAVGDVAPGVVATVARGVEVRVRPIVGLALPI